MNDSPSKSKKLVDLLAEFIKIDLRKLKKVWYVWSYQSLETIMLELDGVVLIIEAEPNYDTITFRIAEAKVRTEYADAIDASESSPWNDYIDKEFGWGWVTINQQNYLDGILLSFGDISPAIVLNVMASSIQISRVADPIPEKDLPGYTLPDLN